MSTKTSNPTVSKLDAAQQDRPTADDQEGNLSEKQVDERLKALPEDTRLLLEKLETEFERRYIGSVSDILEWNAYLTKTLEKPNLVDLFTKWTFFVGLSQRMISEQSTWRSLGSTLPLQTGSFRTKTMTACST
jgi:hypothetical protein